MNTKLLRKVAKHIVQDGRRLDMGNWVKKLLWDDDSKHSPPCGTVACIAGWTVLLTKAKPHEEPRKTAGRLKSTTSIEKSGRKALGLDYAQARTLFFMDNWPERFVVQYGKAKGPQGRARATLRRIQHFIKTKGME